MRKNDSTSISFTAYYTGEVWRQHGLSDPMFATPTGRVLYGIGRPIEATVTAIAGASIRTTLLQRHQLIDAVVKRAITEQGISQIVEIACGMSPRGVLLRREFPQLDYIEADLPDMAAHKRQLLQDQGLLGAQHQVVDINILDRDGVQSVAAVFAGLDHRKNTLVITEGLVNYFPLAQIAPFWQRLSEALKTFPNGAYITDLYPNLTWHPFVRLSNLFQQGLGVATRSSVTLHFEHHQAIEQGFADCGFAQTQVHVPESYFGVLPIPTSRVPSLVRVVENWV